MVVANGDAILTQPDGRQHSLCERPSEHPIGIQLQSIGQATESPLDCAWLQEHFRVLDWISEGRANLVLRFAQHAFGIDGDPPALRIVQYVAVMQVAVQQAAVPLR